jgi:hypothetical protein
VAKNISKSPNVFPTNPWWQETIGDHQTGFLPIFAGKKCLAIARHFSHPSFVVKNA